MDLIQTLLAFLTPIGLALFALIITREGQKDRAVENLRRDKREESDRDQRAKDWQQFMLLFATLTGKQESSTATVVKSGVDSESRVTQQTATSEAAIKARVQAVGDAQLSAIEVLYKLTDSGFKSLLANPQDPMALAKVQKAIELLTATVQAVQDDLTGAKVDIATNAEVGTANTGAITAAHDALVAANVTATTEVPAAVAPAPVVITDVSAAAMETIKGAMMPAADAGAATEGGEELGKIA